MILAVTGARRVTDYIVKARAYIAKSNVALGITS